ncbi:MAG TPA: hypothetical protein VF209_04245 [Patescibacteria group bacterium]
MPQAAPTSRPRMGGGFNQGLGDFGEHLDEQAMMQAAQQKSLAQQGTNQQQSVQQGQGGQKAQQDLTAAQAPEAVGQTQAQPVKPRALGTVPEELVVRPATDILKGLASIFDINALLGINTQEDPQTQAKKKQLHQRWQQLTQEEQQVAQRKYQAEMQKKKAEEEEKERRRQEEEKQKAESIAPPSSPKKGPVGPGGSGKQRAVAKLEQDRKKLGGPSSAN